MQLVSFVHGRRPRLGVALAGRILDLQAAHLAMQEKEEGPLSAGSRRLAAAQLPADCRSFIEVGAGALAAAGRVVAAAAAGQLPADLVAAPGEPVWYEAEAVRLLAPITNPAKLICIGLNYRDHAVETNKPVPKNPVLFAKFATSIIGPRQPIVHPGTHITQRLDYEAELAVVIGKAGKNIPAAAALDHVFGYTIMNDISARDLQMEDGQWLKGKALDTFAPLGPALVTIDEVPDPHNLRISLTLNGQTMQDSNTGNLIFKVPQLIAYISQLMTLLPGDIIATGTPAGVGMARRPPVYMQPGDEVAVEVAGLGVLSNPVIG